MLSKHRPLNSRQYVKTRSRSLSRCLAYHDHHKCRSLFHFRKSIEKSFRGFESIDQKRQSIFFVPHRHVGAPSARLRSPGFVRAGPPSAVLRGSSFSPSKHASMGSPTGVTGVRIRASQLCQNENPGNEVGGVFALCFSLWKTEKKRLDFSESYDIIPCVWRLSSAG